MLWNCFTASVVYAVSLCDLEDHLFAHQLEDAEKVDVHQGGEQRGLQVRCAVWFKVVIPWPGSMSGVPQDLFNCIAK